MTLEHLGVTKEIQTADKLQDDIRKALKEKGGEKFKDITDDITFSATQLAPGVIVEVEATYKGEDTYTYIREDYDITNIPKVLEEHTEDAKAVQIDYVGAGALPISNEDVLAKLKDAIDKLSEFITSAAIKQMSFSGSSPLTPGGTTAVTVTVTYPGNTLKDGHYDKKTTDIKVKEKAQSQ